MDFWLPRRQTHSHIIGGTRTGKSKFLEYLIRKDIIAQRPFCLIDWHGTLYKSVLQFIAYLRPRQPITLLNPSEPNFITGFNPFSGDGETSALVSRRIQSVMRAWGQTNSNEMPTFERIARMLFTFAVEAHETLPNASLLLRFPKKELRQYAIRQIRDEYIRQQWTELQYVKTLKEWHSHILSTDNRLARFLGSKGVKRFLGMKSGNLDILAGMESGNSLLVNLGASEYLDRESGKVFAALLLTEFFEAAMKRAGTPKLYTLYLDEFQEYVTDDLPSMLDQVLKGGLHLCMAHQHLGHLLDPKLKESIFTNARIRAVFGGLSYPTASEIAQEMFLDRINQRDVKATYHRTFHRYALESYETTTEGTSDFSSVTPNKDGETKTSGDGTSYSTVSGTRYAPYEARELASEAEWGREDKISRMAGQIRKLPQRQCYVKIESGEPQLFTVPRISGSCLSPRRVVEYERKVYEAQHAIPGPEADLLLQESERLFVNQAKALAPESYGRKRR